MNQNQLQKLPQNPKKAEKNPPQNQKRVETNPPQNQKLPQNQATKSLKPPPNPKKPEIPNQKLQEIELVIVMDNLSVKMARIKVQIKVLLKEQKKTEQRKEAMVCLHSDLIHLFIVFSCVCL